MSGHPVFSHVAMIRWGACWAPPFGLLGSAFFVCLVYAELPVGVLPNPAGRATGGEDRFGQESQPDVRRVAARARSSVGRTGAGRSLLSLIDSSHGVTFSNGTEHRCRMTMASNLELPNLPNRRVHTWCIK